MEVNDNFNANKGNIPLGAACIAGALLLGFSITTHAAIVPAYDIYATPDRLVTIAPGRQLNLRCTGKGKPTIILESGLGFPSYSWRKVQPQVARTHRVCSYDRAGLGFSSPGPLPRDADAIARDLSALVDAAGLTPPFVLVGSSLGSQSVRLFAFRRPADTAGLVLVDPYVEGQFERLAGIASAIGVENAVARAEERACLYRLLAGNIDAERAERLGCIGAPDPEFSPRLLAVVRSQRLRPDNARAVDSESAMLESASSDQLRSATHSFGTMPIVVLTAGASFADSGQDAPTEAALLAEKRRLHANIAALSSAGREELVPGSSHVIQASDPDAVVKAILEVASAAAAAP